VCGGTLDLARWDPIAHRGFRLSLGVFAKRTGIRGPYRAVGPYWVPLYAAPCKVESVTPRYFLPFRDTGSLRVRGSIPLSSTTKLLILKVFLSHLRRRSRSMLQPCCNRTPIKKRPPRTPAGTTTAAYRLHANCAGAAHQPAPPTKRLLRR